MSLTRLYSQVLLTALITSLLSGPTYAAQQTKVYAPHRPIAPRVRDSQVQRQPPMERSMVGGFWMIDPNRKASIYLKNSLEISPLTVSPILYLSNGARYVLTPVTIEPSGTAVVSINDGLDKQGIAPYATLSGYVEIQYMWAWDPICATVVSVDPIHSVIFTYGLQPSDITKITHVAVPPPKVIDGMNAVEGMWWKPEANVTGFVALSNTSSVPTEAKVLSSDSQDKPISEQSVHIAPHATKMLKLDELQWVAPGTAGGLRILYSGRGDGMVINGGLEDQTSGYSAILPFHLLGSPPPEQAGLETYAEVGLMTGEADPMMTFPAGTVFAPFSVVRNVGDQPVQVTPSLYWMQGAKPGSARLPSFTLEPFEARALDVSGLQASAGLSGFNGSVNLTLDAQGKPRSLLMASGSVDKKNNYVFQVAPHGVLESASKTISYWSTANGDDTMVTAWNPADEAQDYIFTLFYTGGHYRTPIHLEPRATQTFNISEIIQNQAPDAEGNVVPATAREGSAMIAGPHADNEGILVVLDAGTYNVRKATCTYYCVTCNGYNYAFLAVTPFTIPTGGGTGLTLTDNWNTGAQYTFSGNWRSNNTSVATVGSSNGSVTGVAPGSVTINATSNYTDYLFNSNYCAVDPICSAQDYPSGGGGGNVTPSVSFSDISYVVVGQTASTTATVNPQGNSTPISLSISSPASIVSPTGTFTQNTNVVVKGLTVGTATITATVSNPDGSTPTVGSTSFQVTSAPPTATITQRTSGTVSSDDAALPNYQNLYGTTNLGAIFPSGTYGGCALGYETIGTITPSVYNSSVIIHRWLISRSDPVNSSSGIIDGPFGDDSPALYRDDLPQSGGSNGKVYDTDAPGVAPGNVDGNTYRYRINFYTYAALPDGTRISPNYYFYVRLSCTRNTFGYQFVNDVPGDNQIGSGSTPLTWNLQ
jgi:hypothetical protein